MGAYRYSTIENVTAFSGNCNMHYLVDVNRICDAIALAVYHGWSVRHLWLKLFRNKER